MSLPRRAASPQQNLFFGGVVRCCVSPQSSAVDEGVPLANYVAFQDEPTPSVSPVHVLWSTPSVSPTQPVVTEASSLLATRRETEQGLPQHWETRQPSLPVSNDGEKVLYSPRDLADDSNDEDESMDLTATCPFTSHPDTSTHDRVLAARDHVAPVFSVPPPLPLRPSIAPAVESDGAAYRLREAFVDDAEGIKALTNALDMTNATSYVWPLDELRSRIADRNPLTIIAVHDESGVVAGCAGIDTDGCPKPLDVFSIGSRVSGCPAAEVYTMPASYCMCRGLLIHPDHQGAGLGSKLHRQRIETLARLFPDTPAVVLSARGSSFEEATATLGPLLEKGLCNDGSQPSSTSVTPQFAKETLFQFTFRTSHGVVHLAHQREKDGWKFVGVDVSDGGPVWCTSVPLDQLVRQYPQSRRPTNVFVDNIPERPLPRLPSRHSIAPSERRLSHFVAFAEPEFG